MINFISALTAIAVYGRITEMGQPISVAIISGVLIGALSHYAINQIKKSIIYGNRNDN